MEILLFKVNETYYSEIYGLILLPGLGENYVPVGTPITIVKPDQSEIDAIITSITFAENFPVSVGKLSKADVPKGSEIWARKTLTYDLNHYSLVYKREIANNFEIKFQHKVDNTYFKIFTLIGIAGMRDSIGSSEMCRKLRINMTGGGSYGNDLAIQQKIDAIRKYPELLIFSDDNYFVVCFQAVVESISFHTSKV